MNHNYLYIIESTTWYEELKDHYEYRGHSFEEIILHPVIKLITKGLEPVSRLSRRQWNWAYLMWELNNGVAPDYELYLPETF